MKSFFSLVKFSHTVFALPFALIGFFIALNNHGLQPVQYKILGLILICMVTARNAAMAFNRWADRFIDQKNERTALREIPSGVVSSKSAIVFILINVVLFIFSAFLINPLCFYLSPVAFGFRTFLSSHWGIYCSHFTYGYVALTLWICSNNMGCRI